MLSWGVFCRGCRVPGAPGFSKDRSLTYWASTPRFAGPPGVGPPFPASAIPDLPRTDDYAKTAAPTKFAGGLTWAGRADKQAAAGPAVLYRRRRFPPAFGAQ